MLTCGHLFRDSQRTGKIDVDVYGTSPAVRVPGRLVGYDLERDVGLVAFRPQGPVMVARVAPPGYTVRAGDAVTSVGCNNGDDPTVQHSRVNSLDRFLDPAEQRGGNAAGRPHAPWNLQVAGQPVIGRSGGGLFSSDGMVIGVCNAAEPVDREGLFAALGSIHAALDQQGLSSLYKQAVAPPAMVPPVDRRHRPLSRSIRSLPAARLPRGCGSPARTRRPHRLRPSPPQRPARLPAHRPTTPPRWPPASRRSWTRSAAVSGEGSEVVCIIRDRNNPQAKSEVITLDRASPAFVNQLSSAGQPRNIPHETSLEVPKRPTPILEWDIETGWRHQGPLP